MSGATSMAELMAKRPNAFQILKQGDIVKATVSKVTSSEMFVKINDKTEAVVLEKDHKLFKQLTHFVKVGDSVEAMVLNSENDLGMPVVSLRKFLDHKLWSSLDNLLQSQEKVPVRIINSTKGGFLVESESGISGFLPNSHISLGEDMEKMVGRSIQAAVVEVVKDQDKVIFSQKGILSAGDFKKLTAHLKTGSKVQGVVSGITTFGLFVSLTPEGKENTPIEGLVHISEVSWQKVEDLSSMYSVGQEVEAVVVGIDADAKRLDLSLKRLSEDPFAKMTGAFPVDKKVSGTVKGIDESGVSVDLGEVDGQKVEGLIKREKISPNTTYEVGQKVNVTVSQIDSRKRKILLTPVLLEKPLMYR